MNFKKILLLIAVFFTLGARESKSESLTLAIVPIAIPALLVPPFVDIGLFAEYVVSAQHTASLGLSYSNSSDSYADASCNPNCLAEGSKPGYGLHTYYRYYVDSFESDSFFGEVGLGVFSGVAQNTLATTATKKTVTEAMASLGFRHHFAQQYFLQGSAGVLARSAEISSLGYPGYSKVTPIISFALGMKF